MPSRPGISLRGIMRRTCATRFTFTNMVRVLGSNAAPPQFAPPALPGVSSVPCTDGGVKMPSERYLRISLRHCQRSQGVKPQASSSVTGPIGTSGAGFTGKGCVFASHSPGRAPVCGTGRSSIGKSGLPVRRSKTNTKPCLVFCTTAGTSAPLRGRSASSGGAETS